MLLFMMLAYTDTVKAEPADSMWIEPAIVDYYTNTTSVGKLFNVTVHVNSTAMAFTWQVKIYYNTSHLNVTSNGVGYTAGAKSEFFDGMMTVPVSPVIDREMGILWIGESLLGASDYANGTGSLCWVEFEVIGAPNETIGMFESVLDMGASSDTFLLDTDILEVTITRYNANYSFAYISDTEGPMIGTPMQDPPSDNVQPDDEVMVSVDVTDAGSGVKNVTLHYTNDTVWYNVSMTHNATSGSWEGIIPEHVEGTMIQYKISAYDNEDNFAEEDNAGAYYVFTVIPEFTSVILLTLMAIATFAAIITRKKLEG
jgi:hypothetical protein